VLQIAVDIFGKKLNTKKKKKMSSTKEEYLMKKGKKRYVVLTGPILQWLLAPLEKTKGSLDIREYEVVEGNN